jgi:hypothetical protein
MALFTDGNIASIEDLKEYESAVLQTANIEGIDLTAKLKLAQREIGFEIASFIGRHGYTSPGDLSRVVTSETILNWHCLRTLELVYRDAYNSQLNDRYLGKWKEYMQTAAHAGAIATELGIGMVSAPVSRAAAPACNTEAGGVLGPRTYFVSVAWQASSGSTGDMSEPTVTAIPLSALLTVQPSGQSPGVSGWYVYAGPSESELRRQNELPLGQQVVWKEPAAGLRSDIPNIPVQRPDWYVRNRRVLQRG